jgi:hypothetical protein
LAIFESEAFELSYEGTILKLSEHYVSDQRIFRVEYPDARKPLVLTVAISFGKKFWTSVPQGRQEEAEKIGRLIALYFKSK